MKRIFKRKSELLALLFVGLMVGCGSDDSATDIIETIDPTSNDITTIRIVEGATDNIDTVTLNGEANSTVKLRVNYKITGTTEMKRLYITQELPGQSPMPFEFPLLKNRAKKRDGSIDLDKSNEKEFDFTFDVNVPSNPNDGQIVYKIWATTGRGDFRDTSKRLLPTFIGTATVGVGTNANAPLVQVSSLKLDAPLADGQSNSFISLLDPSTPYQIKAGAGLVSFWDFGYFFGNTGKASFASANGYSSLIVDLVKIANENKEDADAADVEKADLNMMYFAKSTKTKADFEGYTTSADLDFIVKSDSQTVNQLTTDAVVEFVDKTGKKGLILVTKVVEGFGNDGEITLDMKIQP